MRQSIFVFLCVLGASQASLAWRCCKPSGGDASGVFATKAHCEKAGQVVHEGLTAACGTTQKGGSVMTFKLCGEGQLAPIKVIVDAFFKSHPKNNDKFFHCSYSCLLTKRCGGFSATSAGLWKEFKDLFDNKKHNSFGSGDLIADTHGVEFGNRVANESACLTSCDGAKDIQPLGPLWNHHK